MKLNSTPSHVFLGPASPSWPRPAVRRASPSAASAGSAAAASPGDGGSDGGSHGGPMDAVGPGKKPGKTQKNPGDVGKKHEKHVFLCFFWDFEDSIYIYMCVCVWEVKPCVSKYLRNKKKMPKGIGHLKWNMPQSQAVLEVPRTRCESQVVSHPSHHFNTC